MKELEKKVKGTAKELNKSSSAQELPFLMYNFKCFFCDQTVKCILLFYLVPEKFRMIKSKKMSDAVPLDLDDLSVTQPIKKYGAGFSHVLKSLRGPETEDRNLSSRRKRIPVSKHIEKNSQRMLSRRNESMGSINTHMPQLVPLYINEKGKPDC